MSKPEKIKPAQIWWDDTGHVSHCDPRAVYIVLGKDSEDYWHCACLSYFGQDIGYLGGNGNHRMTDKELLEMVYIGYLPTEELASTIGDYEDFMLDREFVKKREAEAK